MTDALQFIAELHWNEGNIAEVVSNTKREIANLTRTGINSGTGASEGKRIIGEVLGAEKAIATAKSKGEISALAASRARLDLTKRIKDLTVEAETAGKGLLAESLRAVSTSKQRTQHPDYRRVEPASTPAMRKDLADQKAQIKAQEKAAEDQRKSQAKTTKQAEADREKAAAAQTKEDKRAERQAAIAARDKAKQADKEEAEKPSSKAEARRDAIKDDIAVREINLGPHIDEYIESLAQLTKLRDEERQWVRALLSGEKDYIETTAALSRSRKEINARSALVESGRDPTEVMQLSGDELLAQAAAAQRQDKDALQAHTFSILNDTRAAIESAQDRRAGKAVFDAQVTGGRKVVEADAALVLAKRKASAQQNLVVAGRPDIAFGDVEARGSLDAESAAAETLRIAAITTDKNTILRNTRASVENLAAKDASTKVLRAEVASTQESIKATAEATRSRKESAARGAMFTAGDPNAFSASISGNALISRGMALQADVNDQLAAEAAALRSSEPAMVDNTAARRNESKKLKQKAASTDESIRADAEYADAAEVAASKVLLTRHGVDVSGLSDEEAVLRGAIMKRAASELRRAEINMGMTDTELSVVQGYRQRTDELNEAFEKRTAASKTATEADIRTTRFQRMLSRFSASNKPPEQEPRLGQFLGQKAVTSGGYMLSGALMAGLTMGIIQTIKDASELEYTFVRLRAQLEGLGEGGQFDQMRADIKGIAVETGQSVTEVGAFMSRILGVFGDAQVATRETQAAMKLAVVASVELKEVQQDLIPIMKAFGITATDVGDVVVGMRDKFGVAEESALSFIGKSAVVAEQAGLEFRELGIIGGYMANSLGKDLGSSADVMNKLPSLMENNQEKIYRILNRNPDTRSFIEPMMEAFGRGEAGQAFITLIKAMGSMDDSQKQAILTSVVSRREAEELNAVLANSAKITADLADKTILGTDSAGKLNNRFRSMEDTVKHTFQALSQAADNLGETMFKLGIGEIFTSIGQAAGGVLGIIGMLTSLFEKFDGVIKGMLPFDMIFGQGPLSSMVQFLGTAYLLSKAFKAFNTVRKEGVFGSVKASIEESVEAGTRRANADGALAASGAIDKETASKNKRAAKAPAAVAGAAAAAKPTDAGPAAKATKTPPAFPPRPSSVARAQAEAQEPKASRLSFLRRSKDDAETTDRETEAKNKGRRATNANIKALNEEAAAKKKVFGLGDVSRRTGRLSKNAALDLEDFAAAADAQEAAARRRMNVPLPGWAAKGTTEWTPGMAAKVRLDEERAAQKAANLANKRQGIQKGSGIAGALGGPVGIGITGAIMTMEAYASNQADIAAGTNDLREKLKKATGAQLDAIIKDNNTVVDKLGALVFREDLPSKLAEYQKRVNETVGSRKRLTAMKERVPAGGGPPKQTIAELFSKEATEEQINRIKDFFLRSDENKELAERLGVEIETLVRPKQGEAAKFRAPGAPETYQNVKLSREKLAELPAKILDLTKEGKDKEAAELQNLFDALTKDPNMKSLNEMINQLVDTTQINEKFDQLGPEAFVGAGFQEMEAAFEAGRLSTKNMVNLYREAIASKEKQIALISDPTKRESAYAQLNQFKKRYLEFENQLLDKEIQNITGNQKLRGTPTPLGDTLRAKLSVLPKHPLEVQASHYNELLDETAAAFDEETNRIADAVKRAERRKAGFKIDPNVRKLRFVADPEAKSVFTQLGSLTGQNEEYWTEYVTSEMEKTGKSATEVMLAYIEPIIFFATTMLGPDNPLTKFYQGIKDTISSGAMEVPDPGETGGPDPIQSEVDRINANADRWKAHLGRLRAERGADPLAAALLGVDESRAEIARLEAIRRTDPDLYNPDDMERALGDLADSNRGVQEAQDAIVEAKLGWAEVLANGDPVLENAAKMDQAKEKLRQALRDNDEAAINNAGQEIERVNQQAVDNNNNIIAARLAYQSALVERDPVEAARAGLEESKFAETIAKGEAAKINAAAERLRAERGLEEAINENFSSRSNLLQALATAAGRPVAAAQEALKEEKRLLDRLVGQGLAMDSTPVQDQVAAVATATRSFLDTDVAEQTDLLDFALEMRKITVAQAIAGYRVQQARYNRDDRAWRDLERKIRSLQEQSSGQDLQFNLPTTLGLPSLYEARRVNQSNGMGIGYQDNRNMVVSIAVNGAQDPMAVAAQVMTAFQSATSAANVYAGGSVGAGV